MCTARRGEKPVAVHKPSSSRLQALELGSKSPGLSGSFTDALGLSQRLSPAAITVHLICCVARTIPSTSLDTGSDGNVDMALEVASVVVDAFGVRDIQGAAADEGAEAGERDRCSRMGGGEHPWVGLVVGAGSWHSAYEGCVVRGSRPSDEAPILKCFI